MDLICPKCLEAETIRLDICDGDTLTCAGCDEEYSLDAVQQLVEGWLKVLPWLLSHPARLPQAQPAAAAKSAK